MSRCGSTTTGNPDSFKVSGRGLLHLGILIENMRREGYELAVSRPQVILKEVNGEVCEPWETLSADVEAQHQGARLKRWPSAAARCRTWCRMAKAACVSNT